MREGIERAYSDLVTASGDDENRDGLRATPARAAEAFTFLTSGYRRDPATEFAEAAFPSESDQMISMKDIELYSLCEHHLLPFFGHAHIAYIPNKSIVGFSNIPTLVDGFAHRLQIQERLTAQIATTVMEALGAQGVGVVIEARHLCVMMRGVRKQRPVIRTSCMLGTFRTDSATRAEFLDLIQ